MILWNFLNAILFIRNQVTISIYCLEILGGVYMPPYDVLTQLKPAVL
ncbi:hypothetical protein VCRA2126O85_150123 [Vibrio crassostreae]|nr:hypothetical protein VCRA2126O86_120001 [Vibrio crassostreae]CAK2595782.1 hypothetical protein VCRA2127O91_120001 [Vibrio crassostreae]CAK2610664.1 hypothetical protein VCRA2126O84_130001 [Vibrio crassostreae]CAK2652727.1 hypothetical protein VCRA2126O85_150123 [Vibrio crassostreae]CAK2746924.1 hypothetical protein VCRA2125O83_10562 [Vibrio crassostreae]